MLVVEDGIMHLPKLPLSGCSLGSQSRVQRVGMNVDEREVAKDKSFSGKRLPASWEALMD